MIDGNEKRFYQLSLELQSSAVTVRLLLLRSQITVGYEQ